MVTKIDKREDNALLMIRFFLSFTLFMRDSTIRNGARLKHGMCIQKLLAVNVRELRERGLDTREPGMIELVELLAKGEGERAQRGAFQLSHGLGGGGGDDARRDGGEVRAVEGLVPAEQHEEQQRGLRARGRRGRGVVRERGLHERARQRD